ncbi:MAG TPA: M28 family peptidase [Vicinamibacterales bacterium]|nr:M28 family peptidase [Vicinamibacterales bacterium]
MYPRSALVLIAAVAAACGGSATPSSAPVPTAGGDRVWPDEGPATWAPRPTTADITANDLRTRLYQISDDSMQGRRIGELGNYKATTYVAAEFQRLGLKPAGEGGGYFQNLPYGASKVDSTRARLIVAGVPATPGTDWIPTAAVANNRIAGDANVRETVAVFVGKWGDSTAVLDANAIRGNVAVFTYNPPTGGRGGAAGGGGGGGGRGGFAAVRDPRTAGAALILVASADSTPRAVTASAFVSRAGMRPEPISGPAAAAISASLAAKIFGRPLSELTPGTTGATVSANWTNEFTPSKYAARNVIAVLPGSNPKLAGEYVLVSAHNDHVGTLPRPVDHDSLRAFNRIMRPQGANDRPGAPTAEQQHQIDSLIRYARSIRKPRLDSINNGADDDGSGTVVLLEIAEKFASEKPARSIIFVSHQGEEAGLLGSRWFTDHPTIPLDSIVAAHNMDMVGKGRASDVKFGGPNSVQTLGSRRLSHEFGDIIDSIAAHGPNPMTIDHSWDVPANPLNRFCRSDQVNYVHHDVPVTYFSTGYSEDYHQPTDEARYIDFDHAARLARFIHDVMFTIANRATKPAISGADPSYPACR